MVKFTSRLLGTRPRFALGCSVGLVRCVRLRTSSLRFHFILESLQRDTRRGRRDQRELRSQVPGVRLHEIDEARLVPVFFGRSKSIVMHLGDGDAERVYDVAGLPCMFRFSRAFLCLLRDTRRHYGTSVVARRSR